MLNRGRSHFYDNTLEDVTRVANEIAGITPKLAHELLMDYQEGSLDEAGGLLFNAKRTGPKYTTKGELKKNSDRITFNRNKFDDLSTSSKIRVLKDNIDGYNELINTTKLSDDELQSRLKPHNPNKIIYDDIKNMLASVADSKTALYSGPGQVGSPGRNGGKQFDRVESLRNAAQFLTEGPTDRLLGTHVSFPQQGHVLDANNNPLLARDIANMRAQQGEPNRQDGADARGLVNMTREQNLINGRNREIDKLLEMIDTRLSENVSERETMNLLNLAQEIQGTNKRFASEDPLVRAILNKSAGDVNTSDQGDVLQRIAAQRDAQAAGAVVGEKPTVINAGEGSRVYVEATGNGNGNKADKIKTILKNGNGKNGRH